MLQVTSPWFFLYAFLFLGAYAQDCLEFLFSQATLRRWWSEQRIWLIRGLTCYLFGTLEYLMQILGIATHGFNVTSKAVDDEQSKRYHQGLFEFGVPSPIFLPLATAAIISFAAFLYGTMLVLKGGNTEDVFVQLFIAGFGVLNCLPIYEAMIIRTDKGKMPTKTTITSIIIASGLYLAAFLMLQI
mgnify:FL=1